MTRKFVALSAFALVLTACAQPEPEPVYVQPSYDKIGNAACPAGYQIATSEAGETICAPL